MATVNLALKDTNAVHPNKRNFIEGLRLIFSRWAAYQMALQMEWGGYNSASKGQEFQTNLIEYFDREGRSIECEDLEEILLEVMAREFNTMVEDGSELEVAKSIWTLYQECIKSKTTLLESLRARAMNPITLPIKGTIGSESSDDGNEEEEGDNNDEIVDEFNDTSVKLVGTIPVYEDSDTIEATTNHTIGRMNEY